MVISSGGGGGGSRAVAVAVAVAEVYRKLSRVTSVHVKTSMFDMCL